MDQKFLNKLSKAKTEQEKSYLIAEFTTVKKGRLWELIQLLAITHSFDEELLVYCFNKLDLKDKQQLLDQLLQLTFVEPFGDDRWTIHDLTRKGILEFLNKSEKTRLQKTARLFYRYYSSKNANTDSTIESIYLLLIADPDKGIQKLKQKARNYRSKRYYSIVEILIDNAKELLELGILENESLIYELEKQEFYTDTSKLDNWRHIRKNNQPDKHFKEALDKFNIRKPIDFEKLSNSKKDFEETVENIKLKALFINLKEAENNKVRQIVWLVEIAGTYRVKEEYDNAHKYIDLALDINDNYLDAIVEKADIYIEQKQYKYASSLLEKAKNISPNDESILQSYYLIHHERKNLESALLYIGQAIKIDKLNFWNFGQRGLTYYKIGKYNKAISDLDTAIELDDTYAWVFGYRGLTYHRIKEYDKAILDFDKAIELDDTYAWILGYRGLTYYKIKEYDKAILDFNKTIKLDNTDAWDFGQRGLTYRMIGNRLILLARKTAKYKKAILDFDTAIRLDSQESWHFGHRGLTYYKMKEYRKAILDFDKAIELNDTYAWAFGYRALTYRKIKKYSKAILDFNRAIELDNTDAWDFSQRGLIYQEIKEYDKAISDFHRAIDLDGTNTWIFLQRGIAYIRTGKYKKALFDFLSLFIVPLKELYSDLSKLKNFLNK